MIGISKNQEIENKYIFDAIEEGFIGDGKTDNIEVWKRLVEKVDFPAKIVFPKGRYYFSQPTILVDRWG